MPKAGPKITTICEVCGIAFERTPAFHRSAEAKGGKVRFCGLKCYGVAKSTGLVTVTTAKGKLTFTCEICGKTFQRWPSNLKWEEARGSAVRFCSQECHGKARTARVIRMPTGIDEYNRKRSDGNRRFWGLPPHSDEVMQLSKPDRAAVTRGFGFTIKQRREWKDTKCARCGSTKRLELDHIVCIAAGGESTRENAQTLCMLCNRWKRRHVDRPLVRQQSLLGS